MSEPNWKNRTLFHGDNLDFLRAMNSESVDLIATDPPFNKGRDFHATPDSLASGAKFQDRWSWEQDVHQEWVDQIKDDYPRLMEAIESARYAHSDGMGAFMCFMAVRLLAMRRVLKPTGSIYLHCDPTASHYLKAIMNAVFGWKNFLNEVVWKRTPFSGSSKARAKQLPRNHDIILLFRKGNKHLWNQPTEPYGSEYLKRFKWKDRRGAYRKTLLKTYSERTLNRLRAEDRLIPPSNDRGNYSYKQYLSESSGVRQIGDIWNDINMLNPVAKERLGYPTQKPLALYERIIEASSNEKDMVLDPFAGCATTLVAAERLNRQWVGIDIWDKAHETVIQRLQKEGLAAPDGSTGGVALPLLGKIHYSDEPPERTDDGETATVALETINRRELAAWQKLSHKDMVAILKEAQADADNSKLVVCAGCGRKLEPEFMELDHITPNPNRIARTIFPTGYCYADRGNGRKSNKLAMTGLRNANKKVGWMVDEDLSKQAVTMAFNAYRKVRRQDS